MADELLPPQDTPLPVHFYNFFNASMPFLSHRLRSKYSQNQNYWRFTDFFTKSSNRPEHASNSTNWGISMQLDHFLSFRLAHILGHAAAFPKPNGER